MRMYGQIDDSLVALLSKEFRMSEALRAVLWMSTRSRRTKDSAYITAQIAQAELARLAFSGNDSQAQRSIRYLIESGVIERLEKGVKGRSSVYRLSDPIPSRNDEMPSQNALLTPQKVAIPPQGDMLEQELRIQTETININKNSIRSDSVDDLFEALWKIYPKQQGGLMAQRRALMALRAALERGVEFGTILDGVTRYAAYTLDQGIEARYAKPIYEYIDNEMWTDRYPCSHASLNRVQGERCSNGAYADKPELPETAECPQCGSEGVLIGAGSKGGTYMCNNCCVGFSRTH